jgi:predicted RNase H-like nuclease (RuvC/YqgF family)
MTLIEMLRANGSWEADAAVTAIQVRDNRIEKLEAELHHCFHRINELQAALREIIQEDALTGKTVFVGDFGKIARKALDGKNDPQTDL